MDFRTPVTLPADLPPVAHTNGLLLLGSCFATHIGQRLTTARFRCDVNPYGVLYNPLSISAALHELMDGKEYGPDDLFFYRDSWHSPMHHTDFSAASQEEALRNINSRLHATRAAWEGLDRLLLTWGTAYVYRNRQNGCVVGNCHKLPEAAFVRQRLSVEEIVEEYTRLLHRLLAGRPGLKVLLTVSPIRHVRDGLHANQLSKSTLLLAADCLQEAFPEQVFYFPAYEIVQDELRDYRFYADDMVHPSDTAVRYVWEQFVHACFSKETVRVAEACEGIHKMLQHKPLQAHSEEYKRFLEQIVLKIDQLTGKYPYLDFEKEREICLTRLNALLN